MVGRGAGVLLLIDKLLESSLLLGAALEHKEHAVERHCIGQSALVEFSAGQWMRVTGEGGAAGVVYRLQNARLGHGKRELRRGEFEN